MPLIDVGTLYVDDDNNIQFGWQNSNVSLIYEETTLVQKIVTRLFTQVGSDGYAPSVGAYFYEILSGSFSEEQKTELSGVITSSLDIVKTDILAEQILTPGLTDEEVLRDIVVDSITYDKYTSSWDIKILVITAANETIFLSFDSSTMGSI